MILRYTSHAEVMLEARSLQRDWIELATRQPDKTMCDPSQPDVTLFFKKIAESANRIIRVAARPVDGGLLVITAFFDRNAEV